MNGWPIGDVRLTATDVVARGPVLFWGIFAVAGAAADSVTLRDGVNGSAPVRLTLEVGAGGQPPVILIRPLLFRQGIHATLGGNMSEVTVLFEPVREEMLGARIEEQASVETE